MDIRFNVSNEEYDIFLNDSARTKKCTTQHGIELTNFNKHFDYNRNSEMVGCFNNKKLIGLAWCPINDENEVTIGDILVHPMFTRKGVGRNIVEAIIEKYANDFLIFTYPLDNNAKKFFLNMGFVKDKIYYPHENGSMFFNTK